MVDELRRKILKGALAGTALLLGHPLISSSIFKEKESVYGMNLTRRFGKGRIVDEGLFEFFDYANIKDFIIHLGIFQKTKYSNEIKEYNECNGFFLENKYIFDLIENIKIKKGRITIAPAVYIPGDKEWLSSKWRGDIEPNNFSVWFKNYEEILMNYIKLTKKFKPEAFSVGVELNTMERFTNNWENLITKIRKEFNGKITYCANWDSYENLKFVDSLDYASISAYFPLRDKNEVLTLEGLINSWRIIGDNLKKFKKETNKNVVFGEIGYRNAKDASTLHEVNLDIEDNFEQRLCYKALNYAIKNNILPVSKAYLWVDNTSDINKLNRVSNSIFGKPVERDIIQYSRG